MSFKKVELYRGFNIYMEQLGTGTWGVSVVEVPTEEVSSLRAPTQGRLPGGFQSKDSAVEAARAHIDRIQKNRRNRAGQATS